MTTKHTYSVGPMEGEDKGFGVVYKVLSSQVNGTFTTIEYALPPGIFVKPHRHSNCDELAFVISGELMFSTGDEVIVAGPGTYVRMPRGVVHGHWNSSGQPARMLAIISPGVLDGYFEELAQTATSKELDPEARKEALSAISARYGATFDHERERVLREKYGLTG